MGSFQKLLIGKMLKWAQYLRSKRTRNFQLTWFYFMLKITRTSLLIWFSLKRSIWMEKAILNQGRLSILKSNRENSSTLTQEELRIMMPQIKIWRNGRELYEVGRRQFMGILKICF